MKALVIVHLSSLDAFASRAGLEETWELAQRIKEKILSWDGPIYVIDQRWPVSDFSEPRLDLVYDVELKKDIRWIFFDDRYENWDFFMRQLRSRLIRDQVKEVTLGGVWYDPAGEFGCVTDVSLVFKRYFKVKVDKNLVGCWPVPVH